MDSVADTQAPPPLVKLTRHPLRWLSNKAQQLVDVLVLAYIGLLIVAALYYLLFETYAPMTHLWHRVIPKNNIRHDVRNVGEGLLGGLLAQQVVWNHYKRRLRKPPNRLDRIEIALHIPNVKDDRRLSVGQLLASPLLVILYALPGFLAAFGIAGLIRHQHVHFALPATHAQAHAASVLTKLQRTWTQNWDKKLMGYSASLFFGRRPAKGVFDDLQLLFAERRVANQQPLRWYHPPTFKARYNDVAAQGGVTVSHSIWLRRIVLAGVPIGLGLAGFGWYVLAYIAKG